MINSLRYLLLLSAFFVVAGCSAGLNPSSQAELAVFGNTGTVAPAATAEYLLQPGDVVSIKFYYNTELNEVVTVRPDGKISLQLIDEVTAIGMTPSELDRVLTKRYSGRLNKPEVAVIVREFSGQQVYVGGEVAVPGTVPTSGNLTTLQAIFQAGGFRDTAELRSVIILRNNGTTKPSFIIVNLAEDLKTLSRHNDIALKPYDVVFVPKTTIAKMNQFVDQYIEKLIPISKSIGFSWVSNVNPEVVVK